MTIEYSLADDVSAAELNALFDAANFPDSENRFSLDEVSVMLERSDTVVTARDSKRLVGAALSLCNGVSVCFLASFAVDRAYQRRGIGKELVQRTREAAGGDRLSLVSVSTPGAVAFYEGIGMERCRNGFIWPRARTAD